MQNNIINMIFPVIPQEEMANFVQQLVQQADEICLQQGTLLTSISDKCVAQFFVVDYAVHGVCITDMVFHIRHIAVPLPILVPLRVVKLDRYVPLKIACERGLDDTVQRVYFRICHQRRVELNLRRKVLNSFAVQHSGHITLC